MFERVDPYMQYTFNRSMKNAHKTKTFSEELENITQTLSTFEYCMSNENIYICRAVVI